MLLLYNIRYDLQCFVCDVLYKRVRVRVYVYVRFTNDTGQRIYLTNAYSYMLTTFRPTDFVKLLFHDIFLSLFRFMLNTY